MKPAFHFLTARSSLFAAAMALALLASFPFGPVPRIVFLFVCVLSPLLFAALRPTREKAEGASGGTTQVMDFLPPLVLGAILRLWNLPGLISWPLNDEGLGAYYAAQWLHGAPSRWFYDFCESPPMEVWALGSWFRIFGATREALTLYAAVLGLITLAAGVWALRRWCQPREALWGSWLLAVSYPFLLMGRLALSVSLLLPWLFILVALLAPRDRPRQPVFDFAVGIFAGLGPYIFHQGFLALLWAVALTAIRSRQTGGRKTLFPFLAGAALMLAPLVFAMARSGYGGYWLTVLGPHLSLWERLHHFLSYLSCLWVGPLAPTGHSYEPLWGGYWDPVTGVAILTGFLLMVRPGSKDSLRPLGALALCLLFPACFSVDVEPLRLLPLSIPSLFIGARGIEYAVGDLPSARRRGVLALGLCLALAWNAGHLFIAYRSAWGPQGTWESASKNRQDAEAFRALAASHPSPGALDFFPGFLPADRARFSLVFIAQGAWGLPRQAADRVSILARPWESQLLEESFPGGWTEDLSRMPPGEPLVLYTAPSREIPETWLKCHEVFLALLEDRISDFRGIRAEIRAEKFLNLLRFTRGIPFLQRRILLAASEEYRLAILGDVTRLGISSEAQARRRAWRDLRNQCLDEARRILPGAPEETDPAFP